MIKRTVFILFLFFAAWTGIAQSKYFVYLQTEPAQPFYIIINNQNISANTSGYLILPQLKEGDYKLKVGFPLNKYPEQTYNFKIDSKDKGYLIKNFGAEGWGLFDLQTMAVEKPLEVKQASEGLAKAPQPETIPKEEVSDFTKVLSKAANDPSLLEKPKPQPVVKETPPVEKPQPPETVAKVTPQKKVEEIVAGASETKPAEIKAPPVLEQRQKEEHAEVKQEPITNTQPVETLTQGTDASVRSVTLVYDDVDENGNVEKVTIVIPEPKKPFGNIQQPQVAKNEPIIVNQQPEKPNRFEVKEMPSLPQQQTATDNKEVTIKASIPNNNCDKTATEDDFLKLRRLMAKKDNDEGMIEQAVAAFKTKCYSTAQLKYLSSMFLSNAGKYNFYEAALSHVSDPQNFGLLANELKDSFYKKKFETLIGR